MTKSFLIFLFAISLTGCVSVKQSTRSLSILHSPEKLKADVDFTYNRLKKLHPRLYEYTPKEVLDYKFDSLKSALTSPMTSNEFFFRLSPVVAAVHQGHTRVLPLEKKMGLFDMAWLGVPGRSPLFWYDLEMFDNRLYMFKRYSLIFSINPGIEVVTVNHRPPSEICNLFRPTIASDGLIQTFINRSLNRNFATYHYFLSGGEDSLLCELKYKDTIRELWLKNFEPIADTTFGKILAKKVPGKETLKEQKALETAKQEEQGFDALTDTYTKNLTFTGPDSTIAVLRVADFQSGKYVQYYKKCFRLLDSLKIPNLILDLRDNPGGQVSDARELFSYLVDTTFNFLDKGEVTSKYSILRAKYFQGNPLLINMILTIGLPLQTIARGIQLLLVEKDSDGRYFFRFPEAETAQARKRRFRGDLFVLANGGTFSAAAILASDLKGLKRGTFIGEETGGSANGTVAGMMALYKLPATKLWLSFGLSNLKPHYPCGPVGRGVLPDIEIRPTLQDRINGIDPAVNWVVEKVGKNK